MGFSFFVSGSGPIVPTALPTDASGNTYLPGTHVSLLITSVSGMCHFRFRNIPFPVPCDVISGSEMCSFRFRNETTDYSQNTSSVS